MGFPLQIDTGAHVGAHGGHALNSRDPMNAQREALGSHGSHHYDGGQKQ